MESSSRAAQCAPTALERIAATGLLAHLWPAKNVLIGMCVCRMLNATLPAASRTEIQIGQNGGLPKDWVLQKLEGSLSVCTSSKITARRFVTAAWRGSVCDTLNKFRSRIERLELRHFGLGADQCFVIDGQMTHLHALDLGYNKIPGTMLASIAALANLRVLRLAHNSLGADGAVALSQALLLDRSSKLLTVLDIEGNGVEDSGLSQISLCLAGLSRLKSLVLSNNLIGDLGVWDLVCIYCHLQPLFLFAFVGPHHFTQPPR